MIVRSNNTVASSQPRPSYFDALERSPTLRERLETAAAEALDLRGEVALGRALLLEVLARLGEIHGKTGTVDAGALMLVQDLIARVSSTVEKAAAIEAKRVDQGIDAAKLVVLLARLRDDLKRNLRRAGQTSALAHVDAAFERAKWTGELTEQQTRELLEAPQSFDVQFRPIERTGDNGKPTEAEAAHDDALSALRAATKEELYRVRDEIKQLESETGEVSLRDRESVRRLVSNEKSSEDNDSDMYGYRSKKDKGSGREGDDGGPDSEGDEP